MIATKFKEGAKILGINNCSKFVGYTLCAKYYMSVVNAPNLNIKEKISTRRHSTVNALVPYIQQTMVGETRKLKNTWIDSSKCKN